MTTDAAMKFIGELNGKKCYWAEEGRFTTPGFYYWDGENNVHVPLPKPKVILPKRPTIAELEAILDKDSDAVIEILPNGEIRATKRESVDLKYLLEELLFIVAQCNIIGSKNQDIVEIRSSANRAVQAITEIEDGGSNG